MEDKKINLTLEEAENVLIVHDSTVHTFRNPGGILLGADHNHKNLLKKMMEFKDTLQIGGEACKNMNHGLVLFDDIGALFIESDNKKLDRYEK